MGGGGGGGGGKWSTVQPVPSLVPGFFLQLNLFLFIEMLASFPVSTPSFFRMLSFFTTCEKKLGVETGNEAKKCHK